MTRLKKALILAGTLLVAAGFVPMLYYSLDDIADSVNNKGNSQLAIMLENAAIAINPNYGGFYVTRAYAYEDEGKYGKSIADADEAMKLEPGCARGYYARGFSYLFSDQLDKAIADARKAIEIFPYASSPYDLLGRSLMKQNKFSEAVAAFTHEIKYSPRSGSAYNRRATAYAAMGNIDLAKADEQKARDLKYKPPGSYSAGLQVALQDVISNSEMIKDDPTDPDNYNRRAEAYVKLEMYNNAIADYSHAISLSKKDTWYFGRAATYQGMHKYTAAIEDYDECIALSPGSVGARVNRGYCYTEIGQYEKAQADFERAIEADSQDPLAFANYAVLLSKKRNHKQAVAELQHAVELDPSSAWRLNERGSEYLALGEYDRALADFDKALSLVPDAKSIIYLRAKSLYKMGSTERSIAAIKTYFEYDQNNAEAYALLGNCYCASGKLRLAVNTYDQALTLNPKCGAAHYGRAMAYEKLGMTNLAVKEKREASNLGYAAET